MKKTARLIAVACVAASLVLLGGCKMLDVFSVDSLIRPPKLTGENAKIQAVFEKNVGSDVTLVNPLMGEFRSAFVFFDFDADGDEEVVVFYTTTDAPNEVRMNMMDFTGGEWVQISDVSGNGSEVYSVEFVDVDADHYNEIAVSWTVSDSRRNKTLSIYRYAEVEKDRYAFSLLSVIQVLDYLILDFDFDDRMELLYLLSDTSVQVTEACLIEYNAERQNMIPVSRVELSRSVEYPVACVYELQNGVYRVYFDCVNFDDRYMTEILEYSVEDSALLRPCDTEGNDLCLQTARTAPVFCRVNADGRVETPISLKYDGAYVYDSATDVTIDLYLTAYAYLDHTVFQYEDVPGYYVDTVENCSIQVADGEQMSLRVFMDKYVIIHRIVEHTLQFYHKTSDNDLAFSITFDDVGDGGSDTQTARTYQIHVDMNSSTAADMSIAGLIEQNIKQLQG